jgi:hypothetical protein
MDDLLVPWMTGLTVLLLGGTAYAFGSFWRARRAVAWNVVNAALTLRSMPPEQVQALEQAVLDMLPGTSFGPKAFQNATPVVRLAFLSMAMHKQGVPPFDADRPFRPINSPHLARSATSHVVAVKTLVELKHGVRLTELE